MGSVGDAYDDAAAESFFAILERELIDRETFRNRTQARIAVFDFMEVSTTLDDVTRPAHSSRRLSTRGGGPKARPGWRRVQPFMKAGELQPAPLGDPCLPLALGAGGEPSASSSGEREFRRGGHVESVSLCTDAVNQRGEEANGPGDLLGLERDEVGLCQLDLVIHVLPGRLSLTSLTCRRSGRSARRPLSDSAFPLRLHHTERSVLAYGAMTRFPSSSRQLPTVQSRGSESGGFSRVPPVLLGRNRSSLGQGAGPLDPFMSACIDDYRSDVFGGRVRAGPVT